MIQQRLWNTQNTESWGKNSQYMYEFEKFSSSKAEQFQSTGRINVQDEAICDSEFHIQSLDTKMVHFISK